MVIAILAAWIGLLWLLVAFGLFERWTTWMKLSPLVLYLALTIGLVIPMTHAAPSGRVAVLAYSVQVAPNVSGIVTEVPIKAGVRMKEGDVLFVLDAAPFAAKVRQLEARLELAKLRVEQKTQLAESGSGRRTELEEAQAEVAELGAQIAAAQWDLEHTTVRAPADGFVPNQALLPGARVNAGVAVMPFIQDKDEVVAMAISQSNLRHVRPGQPADVIFDMYPGQTFTGRVKFLVRSNPTGQVTPSGFGLSAKRVVEQPFVVELELDERVAHLPPGAIGEAAVYTDFAPVTHAVRRVMIRMKSWLNYLPIGNS